MFFKRSLCDLPYLSWFLKAGYIETSLVLHLLWRATARKGEEVGRRQPKSFNGDSFNNPQALALSCCQESSGCISFFNPDSSTLRLSPSSMVVNVFMPVQTASSLHVVSMYPTSTAGPLSLTKGSSNFKTYSPSVLFFRKPCLFCFPIWIILYCPQWTLFIDLNLYYNTYHFNYSS